MEFSERLRLAMESIGDHRARVAASGMGVFWGSAAIVLMLAWGAGFGVFMDRQLSRYGQPSLFVIPGVTSSGFPGVRPGVRVRVSREEVESAERENETLVSAILAEHRASERVLVEASGRLRRLDLNGTDERFAKYRSFYMAAGRFLDATDVARERAVAVLGWEAARDLFDDPLRAVGERIRVEGVSFELIGVMDEKSGQQKFNTNRPDNRLLVVPITTAESRLGHPKEEIPWMTIYPRPGAASDEVLRAVVASLARQNGFHPDDTDAIRAFDTTQLLGLGDLLVIAFTVFIGVAGTVTLMVGGVGIANFHLAMLAERAVEIGVAKALGARNGTLMIQTALEALIVAGSAALSGAATGLAGCAALKNFAPPGMFPTPIISPGVIAVTLTALVAVALIAALIPALRIRHMDVSAALRDA
ncbi:MAG: FtsX-like permease family protein [bacterium]|nr:FtsX-like permease family protein [bacterium]